MRKGSPKFLCYSSHGFCFFFLIISRFFSFISIWCQLLFSLDMAFFSSSARSPELLWTMGTILGGLAHCGPEMMTALVATSSEQISRQNSLLTQWTTKKKNKMNVASLGEWAMGVLCPSLLMCAGGHGQRTHNKCLAEHSFITAHKRRYILDYSCTGDAAGHNTTQRIRMYKYIKFENIIKVSSKVIS